MSLELNALKIIVLVVHAGFKCSCLCANLMNVLRDVQGWIQGIP